MTSHLLKTLREVLMDAVHVSFDFFKVLIPISIAMKILAELDWIRYLALPLEPVMQLTGLPADLGIAWATGIMVNFYSALIVFIGLLPGLPPLTTEKVTTLAVMMLIAHSIPAEGRIAAQCGVSFIGQAVIRLVVAVIGGVIVHTSGEGVKTMRAGVSSQPNAWQDVCTMTPPMTATTSRMTACSGGRSGKSETSSASSA